MSRATENSGRSGKALLTPLTPCNLQGSLFYLGQRKYYADRIIAYFHVILKCTISVFVERDKTLLLAYASKKS